MRHLRFRIIAALLTFVLGVTGAWLAGLFPETGMSLLARVSPTLVFRPTGRGCGPGGYAQGYSFPDGQTMSEGSACYETPEAAKEGLKVEIAKAAKVIERVPKFKNRHGDEGERIVLIVSDESGNEHANILWYGGGRCLLWIGAPTLDIALMFEKADAYAY